MSFGGEIASAFVRIRPNLSTFKSETTAGVKGALREMQAEVSAAARANVAADTRQVEANQRLAASYAEIAAAAQKGSIEQQVASRRAAEVAAEANRMVGATAEAAVLPVHRLRGAFHGLGGVLGIAFGAYEGVKFVKEITGSAAAVQKYTEVIKTQFGEAGEKINKFAENAGVALGIAPEKAKQTAARFGILFHNLGIGQGVAANMTVGFEKLAGSLSAIQGKDPSDVMQKIVLAAAGNLRGLKQLGIVVDQTQIKYAALKLGLISTVKDSITPAIKAQAIYALATKNLPQFLDQAKAHANDYANVQRRLTAEWSKAKDELGTKLLPIFTRVATFLADNLPNAIKLTSRAFHDLAADVRGIADFVRPAFEAIRNSATGSKIALGALAAGVTALVIAAFPITGTVLAIAALGVAFREAYNRSASFREAVQNIEEKIRSLRPTFDQVVRYLEGLWQRWGETIKRVVSVYFETAINLVKDELRVLKGVFEVFSGILSGDWGKAWRGLKDIVAGALTGVKDVVVGWGKTILAILDGIWNNIKIGAEGMLLKIVHIFAQIPTKIKLPLVGTVGVDNPFKKMEENLTNHIQLLREKWDAANNMGADFAGNVHARGAAASDAIAKRLSDPWTAGVKKMSAIVDATLAAAIAAREAAIAKAHAAAATSGEAAADALFAKNMATAIANAKQRVVAAIKSGDAAVQRAAVEAGNNLVAIGKKLTATINTFLDSGPTNEALARGPLGQAAKRIAELIKTGHGGPELLREAQRVTSMIQAEQAQGGPLAEKKKQIGKHIADLVDDVNHGVITIKSFHSRVIAYLKSQGVEYAKIGKDLGRAQGHAYIAELNALFKQAGLIIAEPKKLRDTAKTSGGGQGIKVVDPNKVAVSAAQKVAAARHAEQMTIQKEALALQKHQAAVEKKHAAEAKKASKAAQASANANAGMAAVAGISGGFLKATTQAPGHAARNARTGAKGSLRTG